MIKSNLTFGGEEVYFMPHHNDVIFFCKNTVGTLSQVKDFLKNRKQFPEKDYFFGPVKLLEQGAFVKADCIDFGTIEELEKGVKFGNEILSDDLINEDIAYDLSNILSDFKHVPQEVLSIYQNRTENKLRAKNQTYAINYEIQGFRREILVALHSAMIEIYGDQSFLETEKGQSGDVVPTILKIDLPDGSTVSIPSGKMRLPGFNRNAFIETFYRYDDFSLHIKGQIQKKNEGEIDKIVKRTKEILNESSIYKNNVLDISFNSDSDYPDDEPNFIDQNALKKEKPLILNQEVQNAILNIIGRITDPEGCKKDGVDVKSTFLLAGPGGTGKTETIFREITPVAIKKGLTVLHIDDAKYYANLLRLAQILSKRGWRIMLVLEDIDQAFDKETRNKLQQDILNTIDGGYNKEMELISLLTTNHIEELNPFFVRRLTEIIDLSGMSFDGAKQFIETYIPSGYLNNGLNYTEVYESLIGVVPSLAKRIVDKTIVTRLARKEKDKSNNFITPTDLLLSVASFKRQQELSVSKGKATKDSTLLGAMQKVLSLISGLDKEVLKELNSNTYYGNDNKISALED